MKMVRESSESNNMNDTADANDTADTNDANDTADTNDANDTADANDANDTADANDANDTADMNDKNDTTCTADSAVAYSLLNTTKYSNTVRTNAKIPLSNPQFHIKTLSPTPNSTLKTTSKPSNRPPHSWCHRCRR
jgi:glucose/arabinose dehydrogenase